jgi:hypothetical protein
MATIEVTIKNDMGLDPGDFESLCDEIFNEIVDNTPVDTGYAQSQWNIDFPNEDTCVISNDCDYISFLEDGHSSQAPNGMVQIALDKFL